MCIELQMQTNMAISNMLGGKWPSHLSVPLMAWIANLFDTDRTIVSPRSSMLGSPNAIRLATRSLVTSLRYCRTSADVQ